MVLCTAVDIVDVKIMAHCRKNWMLKNNNNTVLLFSYTLLNLSGNLSFQNMIHSESLKK